MTATTLLAVLFCLSVSLEGGEPQRGPDDLELFGADGKPLTGPNPNPGRLTLGFGAVRLPLFRDGRAAVHFLQAVLGGLAAGGVGLLFVLVWTAGFLPEFLQPGVATVLLAKPAPRWLLLAGKYAGVVAVVATQAAAFFAGTWLALGLRTGVWLPGYLVGIPLLVLHFAAVYSFTVLLAVATRSTVACVFGSVLFWLACFGINYGRHAVRSLPELEAASGPVTGVVAEAFYWLMPKPVDVLLMLEGALGSGEHLATLPAFAATQSTSAEGWAVAVLSSFGFAALALYAAAAQLARTDY